jgi:hypothetical protein
MNINITEEARQTIILLLGKRALDYIEDNMELDLENFALSEKIRAVESIRENYYRLIEQDRGLIGADTVLDMIDAALQ